MIVFVSHVGSTSTRAPVCWPSDWPIPRVGDGFYIPNADEVRAVRSVSWYPEGDPNEPDSLPFIYVVVGPLS